MRTSWIVTLLILLGTFRIASTWTTFAYTSDEPAHIACGMEWLDQGTYHYEDQHPPLARIAAALLPYLHGARGKGLPNMSEEGSALFGNAPVSLNLTLARAGMLPFFWIACLSLFWLARQLCGERIAVIALALFSTLPPILAHAGLATTDMALTAGMALALSALFFWVRNPSTGRAALLGVGIACAVAAKFSSLPFLPAAAAGMLLPMTLAYPARARDFLLRSKHLAQFVFALAVTALLVWALYRFSWGRVRGAGPLRPAPEFWAGIKTVRWHNRTGALSWLFGKLSPRGFVWFYPVGVALKSPLPWLLLVAAGVALGWRNVRMWSALGSSLGVLIVAMIFGHINLGIRHILPVYAGLSVVAALGLNSLWESRMTTVLAAALALWLAIGTARAHPDYLPYFNELAGSHPERILIDSDLDWGQDELRLEHRLAAAHATRVALLSSASAPRGVELDSFSLDAPQSGWNAADITPLTLRAAQARQREPGRTFWFERMPVEHIGKGILLWWVDPARGEPRLQLH
jgi:hypothetical protein